MNTDLVLLVHNATVIFLRSCDLMLMTCDVIRSIISYFIDHVSKVIAEADFPDIDDALWEWRVTLLICAGVIILLIFARQGSKSPGKETATNVKLQEYEGSVFNWSVFDLAKTAFEPGHTEAVIQLVEKLGYDVNSAIPSNGLTLFLCACLSGKRQLIKYMIHKGADVTRTTRTGDSAVYLATFGVTSSPKPEVEALADIIDAGCYVDRANLSGYTALHRAAGSGNLTVIRTLLKCGADPYQATSLGIYPIDSAINNGHLQAAELLKLNVSNQHVWDVVDPHTPPHIRLGLQSPQRKHLMDSTRRPNLFSPRVAALRNING